MSGPPPKDPKLRRRRNKVSTAAELAPPDPKRPVPPLPKRGQGEPRWHPETLDYWRRIWRSDMAGQYVDADIPGLVGLMKLQDRFNYGELALAAEIRLQRMCFGLTPIDRRRLQWTGAKSVVLDEEAAKPKAVPLPPEALDPRKALRAIK